MGFKREDAILLQNGNGSGPKSRLEFCSARDVSVRGVKESDGCISIKLSFFLWLLGFETKRTKPTVGVCLSNCPSIHYNCLKKRQIQRYIVSQAQEATVGQFCGSSISVSALTTSLPHWAKGNVSLFDPWFHKLHVERESHPLPVVAWKGLLIPCTNPRISMCDCKAYFAVYVCHSITVQANARVDHLFACVVWVCACFRKKALALSLLGDAWGLLLTATLKAYPPAWWRFTFI